MATPKGEGPQTPKGGTPADAGVLARIGRGLRYAFTGDADFFGPGTPLAPVAQEQARGRAFDYTPGFNLQTQPRSEEPISYATLRALADTFDLVRLAIETRKDQMGKLRWTIKRRDGKPQDAKAKEIEEFLQEPDGEYDFADWLRMLLEDVFVIDAPAVWIHPTLGGAPFALEQIDGATIKRILDDRGRTPTAPAPAYQQIIKGLPATDYHADELIFKPRNPRRHKVFGYSPVEQLILIINLGLRRQAHQLAFYTAGNIPEMLMSTPQNWSAEQIAQFQAYWDLMLAGDLEARRQLRFVPGDIKPLPLRPETSLFDGFDEWIVRVVCYCFSLSPMGFVKMMNRATGETAQDMALEEGLSPIMEWTVAFMNRLIRKGWKTSDYEFAWEEEIDVDPFKQAQIDEIYLRSKARRVNEVRADHGWKPDAELEDAQMAPPPAPLGGALAAPGVGDEQSGGPPSKGKGTRGKGGNAAQEPGGDDAEEEDASSAAAKLVKARARSRHY